MKREPLIVRGVRGRFPHRAGKVESRHVEANVQQDGEHVYIQLNDDERPDFWLEIVVEVNGTQAR